MAPMIRDRDLLVLKLASIFEEIGQVGGDIQYVFNAKLFENIQVSRVLGAAQVEVWQDFHREGRLVVRQRAAIRVGGTVRISVNIGFHI